MRFDPLDPYPLGVDPAGQLQEARRHSEAVDDWLGLRIDATERALFDRRADRDARAQDQEIWLERGPPVFLTPYSEIRELLARVRPSPGSTIVDLGAGYGRMGFVLARHFPDCLFTGYEFVPERAREGERVLRARSCAGARLIEADCASPAFCPPPADVFFIYDFGSRRAIQKVLADLRALSMRRPLAVAARGRAARDAIERGEPWLSHVVPPSHGPHVSIYRTM